VNCVVSNLNNAGAGSLRDAVAQANATVNVPDTITFTTAGQITLTTGEIAVTDSLSINATPANLLTINGNNASRIFNTAAGLASMVFTVNHATLAFGKANEGGAINIGDETVNLLDCSLIANVALTEGGAINVQGNGTLNLTRTTISGNTAATDGGAIYWNTSGGGTILNSAIINNKATAGIGGGVYFFGTPNANGLTFRNTTISGNSSGSSGGGIVLTNLSGPVTIQNSTITANTAATGNGGGLARDSGTGAVTIESTILSSNSATTGADFSSTSGTFTIRQRKGQRKGDKGKGSG